MDRAGKTCSLLPQAVSLPRLTWPWYMGASSLHVVWLLFADFQYKLWGLCPPSEDPNMQNVNTAHRKQYLCPRITRWRHPTGPVRPIKMQVAHQSKNSYIYWDQFNTCRPKILSEDGNRFSFWNIVLRFAFWYSGYPLSYNSMEHSTCWEANSSSYTQ